MHGNCALKALTQLLFIVGLFFLNFFIVALLDLFYKYFSRAKNYSF